MRTIRILTIVAAVVVAIYSVVTYFTSIGNKDKPVITCIADATIESSVGITDEELLKYVVATDKQDGDLTHKIKVTRQNRFLGDGSKTIVITYSVCDSDNNVSTEHRLLYFADYKQPQIELTGDFIFSSGRVYSLTDYVYATDMIDGELKNYIKIISQDFSNTDGTYPVNIKVSNSMGDVSELNIQAIVTSKDYFSTKVRLKKYVTYVSKGSTVDYTSFLDGIVRSDTSQHYTLEDVTVDSSGDDLSTPGTYDAFYKIINSNGDVVTMTRLVVVVTEG